MAINRRAIILLGSWTLALGAIVGGGTLYGRQSTAVPTPVFSNIDYANFDAQRNALDLYLPEKAKEPPPLVVWIHGGGWSEGDKEFPLAVRRFLNEGFAVASINYRLSGQAKWPAQLEDVASAIRMLRGNGDRLGYDGRRIALFGASAGGHLAATAGLAFAADPITRPTAVVNWYGPTDLTKLDFDMAALGRTSAFGRAVDPKSPPSRLIGASVALAPDKAFAASPVSYIEGLKQAPPPFLIMHGDDDAYVAPAQSARLHKMINAKFGRGTARYVLVHGGTHGGGGFDRQATENEVVKFLHAAFEI